MRKKLDPHGVFLNDYLRRLFCISVPTDLCASNLPSLASSLPRRSSDWVRLLRFGSVRAATPQCVLGLRSELETQPSTDQVLPALGVFLVTALIASTASLSSARSILPRGL